MSILPLTPSGVVPPATTTAISTAFSVTQASQTITFPALTSPVNYGVPAITLAATASSKLAVTYSATGPGSIAGNLLTITGAGTVVVTASQSGSSGYSAATPVSQTIIVNKAASATTISSSTSNAAFNSPVVLTATVSSTAGKPTGDVEFLDGTTSLGTSTLSAAGVATFTTSTLAPGKHSLTSVYAGDTNFIGSSSSTAAVDVAMESQTIAFPSPGAAVTYGVAPIALKATASSGLAVSFSATGPGIITGSTIDYPRSWRRGRDRVAGGNATYAAATSVSQTIVVSKAVSATTLASSAASANLNAPVTFTAMVTSTAGTPTGAVQFLDGTTLLGTSALNGTAVATYTTSALAAGSHTIDAVYIGDSNFAGSQSTFAQSVTAPGFTLAADPTSLSLKAGQTGEIKVTLTPVGGYTGSLTLACSGLPNLASCSFNPATLAANGSNTAVTTTLTIITTGSNQGTVSQLAPGAPASGAMKTMVCWLPGGLAGFLLLWKRKRLSGALKSAMWMIVLAAGVSGIAACGGGSMGGGGSTMPSTPPGTSTMTISASGAGSSSQSLSLNITVTN